VEQRRQYVPLFVLASSNIRRLAWTNVHDTAPWRGTLWNHSERMSFLRAAGLALPILFVCLLGFRLECIHIDVLHTVDLGTNAHIVANVFWHIAVNKRVFGGAAQEICINELWKRLKQWYQDTKCNRRIQGKLTLERVRTSAGWPKLKAKGAATRHLIRFCVFLMETYSDGGNEDLKILNLCKLMARFYDLIESQSQFFTQSALMEMSLLSKTLCAIYADLSAAAFAPPTVKMWKTMPKIHLFQHLCEYMIFYQGNPKYFWTYQDESLVGDMIELCQSVHVNTLAISALFKWVHIVFGHASPDDE
jgi:hypothetical protein